MRHSAEDEESTGAFAWTQSEDTVGTQHPGKCGEDAMILHAENEKNKSCWCRNEGASMVRRVRDRPTSVTTAGTQMERSGSGRYPIVGK